MGLLTLFAFRKKLFCYDYDVHSKQLLTEFNTTQNLFEVITGRKEVDLLSDESIQKYYDGKRVLITGAGGTIGSAVARRLVEANIKETFYLDRDESALHALALSMSNTAASHSENCIVSDVRDVSGLMTILDELKPSVVIHTAALKHLVVLERFPREGVLTNVFGTLNVLKASIASGVSQILNVSTDKAARPTSILGKTKLIAEHLTQECSSKLMLTSSVRFGNVFASRGSVIETFIHQIKNDLPVTVTHPEVTRFFMSHNEAANLILASCAMKKNATFVQEMGTRISIVEVVEKLGKILGKKPNIRFVGLQSGEKLHEELYERSFLPTASHGIVELPFNGNIGIQGLISDNALPRNHEEATSLVEFIIKKIEDFK